MKNILNIDNGIPTLLSNVDDGTNTLYINDELVPSSEWTGTGYYTFTSGGLTFTIQKIRDDSGNIMLQLIERSGGTSYRLIKAISTDDKYYSIEDPAETDLADGDYVPFYDTSAGAKKKSLWSNIVNKLKSVFVPLITNTGIGSIYGHGQYQWGKIAILTITSTYTDGPVVFEVSQRKYAFSILQVSFKNVNSVDPELDYFITDNDNHYYIKKVATSTWELYAKYSESYGGLALHRVTGYRTNSYVDVNLVMENIAEPTGVIQVSGTKLPLTGGSLTGDLELKSGWLVLSTANSSSDDSGDIVFYYGNGNEKARLWTDNEYTSAAGLNYRVYKKDGTMLSSGRIPFNDNSVRDYYATSMVTKFGYGSPGMSESDVTWLGAWDASVSGEYRLRGVKKAELRVGYAAVAGSAGSCIGNAATATKATNATKYDEIFSGYCSAANTFQTKSLTSGKKFSDYKYVIVESRQYGNTTQVYVEAVDRFKQHNGVGNRIIMQAVTGEQYQVYYVSDTQIALAQTNVNGSYLSLHLYGMIGV